MANIFLFNGGMYKPKLVGNDRAHDDGRMRQPLNCKEAQVVLHDPMLPGPDAPGAFGSTLPMEKYIGTSTENGGLGGLAVGDYVYSHLLPPMSIFRSLAIATDYAVAGFTADFEIVDACEVYSNIKCGGAEPTPMAAPIPHDFGKALGNSVYSAELETCFWNKHLENDYDGDPIRDEKSVTHAKLDDDVLTQGYAAYVRMKITAVPDEWACPCSSCGDKHPLPRIQTSLTGHVTCIRMNEILEHCTCPSIICAGCGDCESGKCDE